MWRTVLTTASSVSTGGFLGKWGSAGSGNGQFDWLSGVAAAPDGRVYVVDVIG